MLINKIHKSLFCILLSFLLVSCYTKIHQTIEQKIYTDNIALNIYIDDMRAKLKLIEIEEVRAFFVYATIIIDNVSEKDVSFELQKICLRCNEKTISTTTYYDTCVSFLMQPIKMQKGERKTYKIYWVVDKKYEKILFSNDLKVVYE